ncbi:lycopene cyclase domain-containing protein [Methylophaga thalassica]|uniref:lycopene cyclase domain-containing protein n=1 Tax=Methylophaga thalassica TaxID=40223 RepID=UPI0039B3D75E
MLGGAIATILCRPDLLSQAIKGALNFTGFYFLFFSAMAAAHPGFVTLYWNHANISGLQICRDSGG